MNLQPQTFKSSLDPKRIQDMLPSGLQMSRPQAALIIIAGALAAPSTSAAEPEHLWEAPYVQSTEFTNSGPVAPIIESTEQSAEITRQAVGELRRFSGLTWEQLGQLFEVSRRSVHFWASGKPLNATNERRLLQVLDVVRDAYRGDSRTTRAALFETIDGTTAFDLLVAQRFGEAAARLGPGTGPVPDKQPELSAAAKAARKPLAPGDMVDALQDRIHRTSGKGRAARTVRNKPRGGE
tara:strand:+ start:1385 stop:2098 length:714 start_codon:yes stop_codon:yes gene_type:complete